MSHPRGAAAMARALADTGFPPTLEELDSYLARLGATPSRTVVVAPSADPRGAAVFDDPTVTLRWWGFDDDLEVVEVRMRQVAPAGSASVVREALTSVLGEPTDSLEGDYLFPFVDRTLAALHRDDSVILRLTQRAVKERRDAAILARTKGLEGLSPLATILARVVLKSLLEPWPEHRGDHPRWLSELGFQPTEARLGAKYQGAFSVHGLRGAYVLHRNQLVEYVICLDEFDEGVIRQTHADTVDVFTDWFGHPHEQPGLHVWAVRGLALAIDLIERVACPPILTLSLLHPELAREQLDDASGRRLIQRTQAELTSITEVLIRPPWPHDPGVLESWLESRGMVMGRTDPAHGVGIINPRGPRGHHGGYGLLDGAVEFVSIALLESDHPARERGLDLCERVISARWGPCDAPVETRRVWHTAEGGIFLDLDGALILTISPGHLEHACVAETA